MFMGRDTPRKIRLSTIPAGWIPSCKSIVEQCGLTGAVDGKYLKLKLIVFVDSLFGDYSGG
jgi:hypothetical protein